MRNISMEIIKSFFSHPAILVILTAALTLISTIFAQMHLQNKKPNIRLEIEPIRTHMGNRFFFAPSIDSMEFEKGKITTQQLIAKINDLSVWGFPYRSLINTNRINELPSDQIDKLSSEPDESILVYRPVVEANFQIFNLSHRPVTIRQIGIRVFNSDKSIARSVIQNIEHGRIESQDILRIETQFDMISMLEKNIITDFIYSHHLGFLMQKGLYFRRHDAAMPDRLVQVEYEIFAITIDGYEYTVKDVADLQAF
ncbi:MAG: hypothetical protein JJU05_12650 [Verrucomicrobia bacterium]|nr:hypothetical protein [Verrucomicrobiota bacterium]MCH8528381.1 hypothetical protein [Kiritimatiellia bacterium]